LSTLSPEYERKFRDGILLPECQAKTAKNMDHRHHIFILWQVAASEIKAVLSFLFLYILGMFFIFWSELIEQFFTYIVTNTESLSEISSDEFGHLLIFT
jgi:hypothetical protein